MNFLKNNLSIVISAIIALVGLSVGAVIVAGAQGGEVLIESVKIRTDDAEWFYLKVSSDKKSFSLSGIPSGRLLNPPGIYADIPSLRTSAVKYQLIGTYVYGNDNNSKKSAIEFSDWAKKNGWTAGFVQGGGWTVYAPKSKEPQISYPIKELGNCKNKEDCKNYCSKTENILACVDYGEKYGLVSPEDAEKAKEFADVLKGEGPGGCKSADECRNYCADISRINECVGFVEKHNLLPPEELKEAKQVMEALAQGASLPGGCRDKDSCKSYCVEPTHAEECLGFAEKAGFISSAEAEEARKVLPFLVKGETPGGCKTKDECENYCAAESNTMECVDFAEKAGFMTEEEAEMVRKTGGKGPGGCRSKESCEDYCNQPENQNACFEFAQKYNLIPEEKLKEIKEGMGRLRAGLAQAPEEAVSCLKEKLGSDIVQKIEDGSFMPGPQTGELIKECFAQAMPKIKEKLEEGLKYADSETKACLEKGLGAGGLDKMLSGEAPSPESGDIIRNCFESMRQSGMKKLQEGLSQMPPEMKSCVEEKLGKEFVAKVERGEEAEVGPEIGEVFQECAGSMTEMMDKMMEGVSTSSSNEIPGSGASIPESACANFKMAPSCDYVPESVRDMCKKCRGE